MSALWLLFPLLCLAGALASDNKALFEQFLAKYNLTYDGPEYGRRFGAFVSNLVRIQGLKASGQEGVGINRFADVDPTEFQQKWLQPLALEKKLAGKNRIGHDQRPAGAGRRTSRVKRQTIPTSFDYRTVGWVTPVKNQGQCGSCLRAPANGMAAESSYPYKALDGTCKTTVTKPYNQGASYYYLSTEADIPDHVYNYGPLAFYIRVPNSFQYYTGGVFDTADCTNNIVGLHEMLIVGYTPTYWIVKNSWGTGFGVSGYVYFARGKNLCGMNNELIAMYM
ncbi:cysteine protease 1 [Aphelenchoides avenae]|nr:cysteine protease 1 [Aphelenchus avenae]